MYRTVPYGLWMMARTTPETVTEEDDTRSETKDKNFNQAKEEEGGTEKDPEIVSKLHEIISVALEFEVKCEYEQAKEMWQCAIRRASRGDHCKGRAHRHEKELEYLDETSRIPLHIAVLGNAPFDVIKAIVDAYPKACEIPYRFDSSYPLHMACMCSKANTCTNESNNSEKRCNEKVIRLLMETYPKAINEVMEGDATALHLLLEHQPSEWLVKRMVHLSTNTSTSQVKIEDGQSPHTVAQPSQKKKHNFILAQVDCDKQVPLHVAIDYNAPDEVVSFLYEEYPKAVESTTVLGFTCLHLAVARKKLRYIKLFAKEFPSLLLKRTDKSKHSWETPLHMLFSFKRGGKQPFTTSNLERLCYKLLNYYKQFVRGEKGKMNYLISRALDINKRSILNVAKTAQRKKLVSEDLFQMLKDAASGNEFRLKSKPSLSAEKQSIESDKNRRKSIDVFYEQGISQNIIQNTKNKDKIIIKKEPLLESDKERLNKQSSIPTDGCTTPLTNKNKPLQQKENQLLGKRMVPNDSSDKGNPTKKTNTALEGSAQMYNYGEVSEVNTIDQSRVSQIEQLEKDKVQLNDIGSATDSAQKGRDTISQFLSNFEDSSVNFDNVSNPDDDSVGLHNLNYPLETELEKIINSEKLVETAAPIVAELETQPEKNNENKTVEMIDKLILTNGMPDGSEDPTIENFSQKDCWNCDNEKDALQCPINVEKIQHNKSTKGIQDSNKTISGENIGESFDATVEENYEGEQVESSVVQTTNASAFPERSLKESQHRKFEHSNSVDIVNNSLNIESHLHLGIKKLKQKDSSALLKFGKRKRRPLHNTFDELIIL